MEKPLHWTACPRYFCHLSKPLQRFPGILFQPIGPRLSLSNQSSSILTNRAVPLDQTVRIWIPHLHEDQPGTRGRDLCPYKPAPLWLEEHIFPLCQGVKLGLPSGLKLWRWAWSGAELWGWRGAWPQGCSTAALFSQPALCHNWAVCHWIASFFTTPQKGDFCWRWTGPQQPLVDTL